MAEQQQVEQPKFNPGEFMRARNEADAAIRAGKTPEPPAPAKPAVAVTPAAPAKPASEGDTEEAAGNHLPRWARREINKAREEAAELRGRLAAYAELNQKPKLETAVADADPEPERKTFATDSEYQRALGRWDARQEAKKLVGERDKNAEQTADQQAWRDHVVAMDAKMEEDKKALDDWEAVAAAAKGDGENAVEFKPDEHGQFMAMMAGSDVRAYLAYHFAKHPPEFETMLSLSKNPEAQIKAFHRLEGRVEKLYTPVDTSHSKAAQASESPAGAKAAASQDRQIPEEGAAGRDARKPKPSSEASARGGGAPPPETPLPGSKAWMEARNREQFGR